MTQDLLPITLFDTNFSFTDASSNIQPSSISSFSQFSSRLPSLSDTEDDLDVNDQVGDVTGANDVPPWSITESDYERFSCGWKGGWSGDIAEAP